MSTATVTHVFPPLFQSECFCCYHIIKYKKSSASSVSKKEKSAEDDK